MFWTIVIALLAVALIAGFIMDRRAKNKHRLASISETDSYRNGPDMMNKSYTAGVTPQGIPGDGGGAGGGS